MRKIVLRIPLWVKASYLVIVVIAMIWALADAQMTFDDWKAWPTSWATYAFIAAWGAMAAALGGLWALLLRWRFRVRLSIKEWVGIQALAWAGRYLPGKVGLLSGRLAVGHRTGLGVVEIGWSVFYEQVAFVAAGAIVALLFLADPSVALGSWWPTLLQSSWPWLRCLLAGALLVAFVIVFGSFGRNAGATRLPAMRHAALLILYSLPHLLVGVAFYAVIRTQVPGAGQAFGVLHAIGLLALANVAGNLAIFAPAGLGVREAVLAGGLIAVLPFSEGLALSGVLRVLTLLADALFCLGVLAHHALTLGRRSGPAA